MSTKVTGQLWYTDGQNNSGLPNPAGDGDEAGVINSDGGFDTTLRAPPTFANPPLATDPWYTGIAVDTAAGYYWVVDNATGPTSDPNAQKLLEYRIGTNVLVGSIQIVPTASIANQDLTNDVVVDAVNHKIYVSTWGDDPTTSGIREFSYNPATGAMSSVSTGLGATHDFVVAGDASGNTDTANTIVSDITAMSLDSANQRLYFVGDDGFFNFAPFGANNAVYVKDLVGGTVTQLTSSSQFPATGADGSTAIDGVAVDAADGKVFFLTNVVGGGGAKLWYVNTTGANQTATQLTLPAGTSLGNGSYYDSLSYDPVNRQLYIDQQFTSGPNANSSGVVVAQLGAGGASISSIVSTIGETTLESGALASYVPLGTQFVSLPLPSFTASGTAAIERGSAVNLLTSTSTSTDASNGYYVGATIAITGGTFSSNENSSSDDHLSVNGVTSGVIAGTNITASYNGATELLTLSGYDTIAHYNDLFKQIQYSATGNNPDNYGANPTRTITWTLLDGETNIPAGSQNSTTTTLSITAVNSAPTLGGAGNSVIYHFGDPAVIVDSALTVSDPDNQNLVGATVKISAGFLSGDTLSFSNQNGIAGSFSGDTLTLSGTATLAQYQTALVSVGYLSTASDPTAGGTDTSRTISWQVNDGSAANQLSNVATSIVTEPACYVEGTLIQTERGKTPVEELRRGDLVITTDGAFRPISWIGRRVVSAVFADPLRCWPIRVMAGALDINVPDRDLLVSPDHALLVDNVLINAGALVNGTSIVRETSVPATFVYYHVELDDHSLILAENTPAETFIDNVDRMGFDNWAEHEVLYPQGKAIDELPFPRAKARRQVPMHIRAALDARAEIVCGDKVIAVA